METTLRVSFLGILHTCEHAYSTSTINTNRTYEHTPLSLAKRYKIYLLNISKSPQHNLRKSATLSQFDVTILCICDL